MDRPAEDSSGLGSWLPLGRTQDGTVSIGGCVNSRATLCVQCVAYAVR
jgi:hypothetical protein